MANPITLQSLSIREAIIDAIYRVHTALDQADLALFDSAFTPDAVFDLSGRVLSGLDAIHDGCYNKISKLDTTHFASNIRVNVEDGDSKASLTASALGQHYREGEGDQEGTTRILAGGLYNIDLVKDDADGLWKIKYWKLKRVWSEGDWSVMTSV
ncbi:hypothetical protein MMC10_001737 [Thelotrema lepadinum]|nr:hypothetical protein [Thelotrema lepadinum]